MYIHPLSEVPVNEVFTTRVGNRLHRLDKRTVELAGTITLQVADIGAPLVPSIKMMASISSSTYTGPVGTRDQKVLELLSSGKSANAGEDFATACACMALLVGCTFYGCGLGSMPFIVQFVACAPRREHTPLTS